LPGLIFFHFCAQRTANQKTIGVCHFCLIINTSCRVYRVCTRDWLVRADLPAPQKSPSASTWNTVCQLRRAKPQLLDGVVRASHLWLMKKETLQRLSVPRRQHQTQELTFLKLSLGDCWTCILWL